jgi:transposase
MAKHRSHSITFKRQIVREYLAGETLHALAKPRGRARDVVFGARSVIGPSPW